MTDPGPKPKKNQQTTPPQEGKLSIAEIWKSIIGESKAALNTPAERPSISDLWGGATKSVTPDDEVAPPPPQEDEEIAPPPPEEYNDEIAPPPPPDFDEEVAPPPPPEEIPTPKPRADQGLFSYVKQLFNTPSTPAEEAKTKAQALDVFEEPTNAIMRGHKQAQVAENLQIGSFTNIKGFDENKAPEIAQLQKEIAAIPVNPSFTAFTESDNPTQAAQAFAADPVGVMTNLFLTSAVSMMEYGATRIPIGAGIGAGLGSVVPVIGTAGGAAGGAVAGMGATSLALEYSSSVIEQLQKAGVDVTDPESLQKAFASKEFMQGIVSHARKKAIPVALADVVTGAMAGKLLAKPAQTTLGKAGQFIGELGVQGVGGAGGEALSEKIAGEKLKFGAILSEAAGEIAGAPVTVGLNTYGAANQVRKVESIISRFSTGNPIIDAMIDDQANTEELGTAVQTPPPVPPSQQTTTEEKPKQQDNAVQEQSTSSQVSHTGEAGQDITESGEGVRPSDQGEEAPIPLSEEEKSKKRIEEQERIKAERKVLQDKVHQTYTEWMEGGTWADHEQAKRNLDALNKFAQELEVKYQEEGRAKQGRKASGYEESPVPPKVASNPRYKAQKAKMDQAHRDAVGEDGSVDLNKLKDAKKEEAALDVIVKDLMRKQSIAEEKAASPSVVTTIAKLREEFYKTLEKGAKLKGKAMNELLDKITEAAKEHKLTPRQITTILNVAKRTSKHTPRQTLKFTNKLQEITANADYANLLEQAESLKEKVKQATKGKKAEGVHKAGKLFSQIDPSEIGIKRLPAYISQAEEIVNHYKSPKSESYAVASSAQIETYADKMNSDLRAERIKDVRDRMDFGEEVSDQDILDYIKSEDNEQSQEEPFSENKDETKKKIIRDKMLKTAEYAKIGLEEKKDVEGKGKQAKVDLIARMDLSKLSVAQLADYIRTADNIIENDDYSGTDRMASRAEAIEDAAKLGNLIKDFKLTDVGSFKQSVYSLPQIFKLAYSQSKIAAEAYRLSGLDGYFNATARVENQETKQDERFTKKFKELKNKYKGFDQAHTQVDAAIFATLVRYAKGTDPNEALAQSKINIEESIKRLGNSEEHAAIAKDAEQSYEKFKDAKSIDEVITIMKKESPGAYEMWEFWKDSFKSEIEQRLKQSSEEFYNSDFVEEENYTHKRFLGTEDNIDEAGVNKNRSINDSIGGRKQSVTSKAATGYLRPNDALDFNFYDNQFKGFRESLYQIETSKPQQKLHEFLSLPESKELLGGEANRKGIIETWKKSDEIARSYGGSTSDRTWQEAGNFIKTLSNIRALGGIYQFPKQYLSVATSTLMNLGSDMGLFFTTNIPEGADALFDQYSIGNRGNRLAGAERGEMRNHRLQSAYAKRGLKIASGISGFSEKGAHAFLYSLRKGDVSVAKRSWAAYYLKSLKDQGIDIKNINLAEEAKLQDQESRQQAAAYAEQKVKETQLTSNPEEQAKLLKTKAGAETAIRNFLIPFSSFSINSKIRVVEAFNQLRKNPGSTEAWKELGAITSEVAVYNAVKTYALSMATDALLKPAIESLFGGKGDSESDKKKRERRNQKFLSDVFKDAMPTTIGTAATSATVEFFNYLHFLAKDPNMSYDKWREKKKELFSTYHQKGIDLGLYGIGLDAIHQTGKDAKLLYDIFRKKPIYITNEYGTKQHVSLTEKEKTFMMWNMLFELSSDVGMMDADFYNAFQKTKREIIKRGKKKASDRDALYETPE